AGPSSLPLLTAVVASRAAPVARDGVAGATGDRMARLAGRAALVTGAASGIGAACARRFAEEGAAVAGLDLREPGEGDWAAAARSAPKSHFVVAEPGDDAAVTRGGARAR